MEHPQNIFTENLKTLHSVGAIKNIHVYSHKALFSGLHQQ